MKQLDKSILIVEDEAALSDALATKFRKEGFSVWTAFDGEEALAMALSKHPDLILLDITMPKKDGLSVMKELRVNDWGKHVPIVLLTNKEPDDHATTLAVAEHEPAFYLIKSDWSLESIVKKVKHRLSVSDE